MKRSLAFALFVALGCGSSTPAEETTPATTPVDHVEPAPLVAETTEVEADPDDVHIVGDHIEIDRHINFETDSDVILADSHDLLDHIALFISHHEDEIAHLSIIGHTDAAGGHQHNQDLSERRAHSVLNALQERGVSIELDSHGVGETEPVCEEDTDDCHAQNRRVEFLIVTEG